MREHVLALTGVAIKSAPGFKIKGKGQMRIQAKPFLGELIVSQRKSKVGEETATPAGVHAAHYQLPTPFQAQTQMASI